MSKNKKEKETAPEKTDESLSWSEVAKKIVFTSLGSAAMAGKVVKDGKREVLNGILEKAEKRKDDFMELLAREVSKFLGKINVSEEVSKALKGLVINLHASIDFKEKPGKKGVHPVTTIHSAEAKKNSSED